MNPSRRTKELPPIPVEDVSGPEPAFSPVAAESIPTATLEGIYSEADSSGDQAGLESAAAVAQEENIYDVSCYTARNS